MALSRTNRFNAQSAATFGTGAYTTTSFTPANNSLLVVIGHADEETDAGLEGTSLTITDSAGLSWQPITATTASTGWSYGVRAWYALVTTGTSMTVSLDAGASNVHRYHLLVDEWTGHDTTTPVGATGINSDATNDGTWSITLSGAPAATSVTYGALSLGLTGATSVNITEGSTWTELFDDTEAGWQTFHGQFLAGHTSTTVSWADINNSGITSAVLGVTGIAFEIKQSAGSPYTLTADAGSYVISGQAANLVEGLDSSLNTAGLVIGSATSFVGEGYIGANEAAPAGSPYTLTADAGSYALTGVAAITRRGYTLVAAAGSYGITGEAALADYAISAGAGSYGITGYDATLTYGGLTSYTLTADVGTYSLTGVVANLLAGRRLVSDQGTYTLSGQDAGLRSTRILVADQGTYSLTGQAANLIAARILAAGNGTYVLSGVDAALNYSGGSTAYTLTAETGNYSLVGQDANLLIGRLLNAAQGTYLLVGQDASVPVTRYLAADAGTYTITGQDANKTQTYVIVADTGVYLIGGNPAVLDYSGEIEVTSAELRALGLSLLRLGGIR